MNNSAIGITDVLIDTINKKYDDIRDLNSLNVNLSEENFEAMIPVIDSIIEDENNNIGKLQQLIDLLSGSDEDIEEGKQETIELIDNSDEFVESITSMKKKLILSENFDNVIDDVQAVADPVFVGANEEHDDNKKKYEDAMKENKKMAEETIPKDEETGKKIKSKELKSMHLSEKLFEEALNSDFVKYCADNISEYILTEFVDLKNSEIREVLKQVINHFSGEDFEESYKDNGVHPKNCETLKEGFNDVKRIIGNDLLNFINTKEAEHKMKIDNRDKKEFIEKAINLLLKYYAKDPTVSEEEQKDLMNRLFKRSFTEKGLLMTESLTEEWFDDVVEESCGKKKVEESLQYNIAKEQIKRFTEGKMPKNWSVDSYLKMLTEKKHITKQEAKRLNEWYKRK